MGIVAEYSQQGKMLTTSILKWQNYPKKRSYRKRLYCLNTDTSQMTSQRFTCMQFDYLIIMIMKNAMF